MKAYYKITLIIFLALSLLFVSGINGCQTTQPEITAEKTQQAMGETLSGKTVEVEITSQGFSPNILTVNAGDTVKWTNKDTSEHWPASAKHPVHNDYPEPGGCIGSKFDACRDLGQGETFTFTFKIKGKWWYQDYLHHSIVGLIIVLPPPMIINK